MPVQSPIQSPVHCPVQSRVHSSLESSFYIDQSHVAVMWSYSYDKAQITNYDENRRQLKTDEV